MRLRLCILRNGLPPVRTLWPITESQTKWTVARLLHDINQIFPLEAEHWGLEDYIVTVSGYECLHYREIGAVCKDEDEITIRPLQTNEVRARTLTGRDQITSDGRHLLDGIPFGKSGLRVSRRPEVRIPPPKRRRLENGDDGEVTEEPLYLTNGEDGEDKDEDDDTDEDEEDDSDFDLDGNGITSSDESSYESSEASEDESDTDDASATKLTSTSDSEVDSDSGSESASDAPWEGIASSAPPTPNRKSRSNSQPTSGTVEMPGKTKSLRENARDVGAVLDSTTKRAASTAEDCEQHKKESMRNSLPNQGKAETKSRNTRRREAAKLKALKKAGMLAQNATLQDLRNLGSNGAASNDPSDRDLSSGQKDDINEHAAATEEPTNSDLALRRQKLLDAISAGGVDVTLDGDGAAPVYDEEMDEGVEERPEEMSTRPSKSASAAAEDVIGESQPEATPDGSDQPFEDALDQPLAATTTTGIAPASVARRSKLDLAGSKRLLFGSLGVRVPRTEQEKDLLRKKLANGPKKPTLIGPQAPSDADAGMDATDGQAVEDYEDWAAKIDLSAVECCDEGVTLSTPPFPFYQRWDPQYRGKKRKQQRESSVYAAAPARKRNRGRNGAEDGGYVETYDKYNTDGTGDGLNYDDTGDDSHWGEGALLDDQAGQELDESTSDDPVSQQLLAEEAAADGFPNLPEDVASLLTLQQDDALVHDYVVYSELVCSAATNWQPSIVNRTVQLQEESQDGWTVKMAQRDVVPRKFDEEGNRMYGKFEVEDPSDEEAEERVRVIQWGDMTEPRLLLRPQSKGT